MGTCLRTVCTACQAFLGSQPAPTHPRCGSDPLGCLGLVHKKLVAELANRRQSNAHTKTRAEVSGGGKKPYAQKGTGNARRGSSRSPLLRGGGVAFGPRHNRNYKQAIPQSRPLLPRHPHLSPPSRGG